MSFVTFGEIMLRLTPSLHREKLLSTSQFNINFAGSESNVASALGNLGNEVAFITKLPHNAIGQNCMQSLNKYGINTDHISVGEGRLGTYFIEIGSSIRPSSVIYDRKYSTFSELSENEFDWDEIFELTNYYFASGITAALSENCANELVKSVQVAAKNQTKVAFDMNYRRSLWKSNKDAQKIFDEILPHVDILFGNNGVMADVYEITSDKNDTIEKTIEVIEKTRSRFGIENYAFTIRNHISASINEVQGIYITNGKIYISKKYTVEILDRLGTGDAFAAGCLHQINNHCSPQEIIEFGTAAFALKHTIYGDQHTSSAEEIEAIAKGNISGHINR